MSRTIYALLVGIDGYDGAFRICFEVSAKERAEHDYAIASARADLGEEAFATAWAEGR